MGVDHAQDAGMKTTVGGPGREGKGQDEGSWGMLRQPGNHGGCGWCRRAGGQGRLLLVPLYSLQLRSL